MVVCGRGGDYSNWRHEALQVPGRKRRRTGSEIERGRFEPYHRSSSARRRRGVALSGADDEVGGPLMIVCRIAKIGLYFSAQTKACVTVTGRRSGSPAASTPA